MAAVETKEVKELQSFFAELSSDEFRQNVDQIDRWLDALGRRIDDLKINLQELSGREARKHVKEYIDEFFTLAVRMRQLQHNKETLIQWIGGEFLADAVKVALLETAWENLLHYKLALNKFLQRHGSRAGFARELGQLNDSALLPRRVMLLKKNAREINWTY